jgi:hypothetical protein
MNNITVGIYSYKGKKLFDMIAKNNKGSDVSQKISGMQKA